MQLLSRGTRRLASVCTGAFVLAEAGLLDGKRATTHWRYAAALQRRFPKVKVDADRIYVKDGDIWTAAGISAGIDLALAMIEEDCGVETSKAVARDLVVYHRRPGALRKPCTRRPRRAEASDGAKTGTEWMGSVRWA